MTTYKKIYNYKDDNRPSKVSIGCELATRQMEHYDMGWGEVAYVPIRTQIVFLEVDKEIAFTKNGECDYKYIKQRLKEKGYGRSFSIMSVWIAQDDTNIF